jgi:peptidyl-prolyl cis-trans isomerase D
MLKQLARLERTRKYTILGFVALMAVSLVVFFRPRAASIAEPVTSSEVVAKVGSDEITVGDLAKIKENYAQMMGNRFNVAALGGHKRLLEGLIHERVVAQEAARFGLAASDSEVREKIRDQFKGASGEFVGFERYKEIVTGRVGDIEKFEQSVRDSIAQTKLRALVAASVKVSDEEVQQKFKRENTEFKLTYVVITPEKVAEKIQPSDEELRNYFEQHKVEYRFYEPQKKIRYVHINTDKIGQKLQITDAELKQRYDSLAPEHKQAGVKVQQILLKVARKDLDVTVEEKAKSLVEKAKAATADKAEQVFADLARGNSEDPATAKSGGFLARVVKKNPNKADALYDQAVDMQVGEITDPIKHGGHWYILRRGEAVPKTFEQAKPELLVSARNNKAFGIANQLAQKVSDRLKETKDAQKVAQEFAAEANMSAADMVQETPYVKPGDDVPNIGSNQQFEQAIAPLNNANDVGTPTGVKGGFAIPMLVDKKEPRIPEFDEVKTKVTDALKQTKAKEQLEAKAKEVVAATASVDQLKAAGEKAGFEVATEDEFKLGKALGTVGVNMVVDEAVYGLKTGELTRTPIKAGDRMVIIGVTERKEADLTEFAKQREEMTRSMLSERQGQVFADYISGILEKMKREGKIKVYDDVLLNLDAADAAAAPEMPPNFSLPQ